MTFGRLLFLGGLSFAIVFLSLSLAVCYLFLNTAEAVDASSVWLLYIPLIGLGISVLGLWAGLRLDHGKNQLLGGSFIFGIGLLCFAVTVFVLINGGSFGATVELGEQWNVHQGLGIIFAFGIACIGAGYQIIRWGPAAVGPAIPFPEKAVSDSRARALGYGLLLSIPLVALLAYLFLG